MTAALDSAADNSGVRAWRFLQKPWSAKRASLYFRWIRAFPKLPLPLRLPSGQWWLVRNDVCSAAILAGQFENEERAFVANFLRAGMTFLDVGAHHGYYTLLTSRRVGSQGQVIAFEPSPREYRFLMRHVKLNRCRNVTVANLALGCSRGDAQLFVVEGSETGCNSLRPPSVSEPTRSYRVRVESLDEYVAAHGIKQVDFIKLDAEGGELEILHGAERLVDAPPRPVILAEVQDLRTRPWGYEAREIVSFLTKRGFCWFRILPKGKIESIAADSESYDGNFAAVPSERFEELVRSGNLPAID